MAHPGQQADLRKEMAFSGPFCFYISWEHCNAKST
jgi:hypothetical protein